MRTRHCGVISVHVAGWALLIPLALGCSPANPDGHAETARRVAPAPEHLYALLINGGGRRQTNYHSHLGHLRQLIAMLEATGVDPERIAVFSADGADPAADLATRDGHLPADFWLLPRGDAVRLRPPIEYVNSEIAGFPLQPATHEALRTWFETTGSTLAPGDTLLLYVTDHGEKNAEDLTDNSITLWGEKLSVSELRELLTQIDPEVRVVMLMSQCYSGSFANVAWREGAVLPAGNTCGYFSTTAERPAYGCYPEVRDLDNLGHSFDFLQELGQAGSFRNAQLRVLQHAHHLRFGKEHLARRARLLGIGQVALIDLDGHVAVVVRIVREIHRAGAADAHFPDDRVLADTLRHLAGRTRLLQ